ncbi:MAG TPA: DUF2069 domain-containing protein [Rudaea sp.]|nr:DUF2069 domain-containing protein [Rudaea sp.]
MTPSIALRAGATAALAQLALQLLWHGWLRPDSRAALAIAALPLLPGLWTCLHDLRRGVLISGIVSLFYFCHGVAGLWAAAGVRLLSATEVVLGVAVIGASYWDARGYRRAAE